MGIDRGSKYIGLAYVLNETDTPIVMPLGYIYNDKTTYYELADMIAKYRVNKIIIGRPARQKDVQEKIDSFLHGLSYVIDKNEIKIEKVLEDYSTVESGEILSEFKKNAGTDTVSAMVILERRQKQNISGSYGETATTAE